jgi:hypothetical protein
MVHEELTILYLIKIKNLLFQTVYIKIKNGDLLSFYLQEGGRFSLKFIHEKGRGKERLTNSK